MKYKDCAYPAKENCNYTWCSGCKGVTKAGVEEQNKAFDAIMRENP